MKLFLSTEEMGKDVMSSGQRLLLLAVIVCEIKVNLVCDVLGLLCVTLRHWLRRLTAHL